MLHELILTLYYLAPELILFASLAGVLALTADYIVRRSLT